MTKTIPNISTYNLNVFFNLGYIISIYSEGKAFVRYCEYLDKYWVFGKMFNEGRPYSQSFI